MPFLNQITISQEKHGIIENILPYAPLIGTIVSAGVAIWIAKEARQISAEQKRIAQEKLDLDLFDKRYRIVTAYNKLLSKSLQPILTVEKIQEYITEFQEDYIFYSIFFKKEHWIYFENSKHFLYSLMSFREDHLNRNEYTDSESRHFESLLNLPSNNIPQIRKTLSEYTPSCLQHLPII